MKASINDKLPKVNTREAYYDIIARVFDEAINKHEGDVDKVWPDLCEWAANVSWLNHPTNTHMILALSDNSEELYTTIRKLYNNDVCLWFAEYRRDNAHKYGISDLRLLNFAQAWYAMREDFIQMCLAYEREGRDYE